MARENVAEIGERKIADRGDIAERGILQKGEYCRKGNIAERGILQKGEYCRNRRFLFMSNAHSKPYGFSFANGVRKFLNMFVGKLFRFECVLDGVRGKFYKYIADLVLF